MNLEKDYFANSYAVAFMDGDSVQYDACIYTEEEAKAEVKKYLWQGIAAWVEETL